MTLSGLLVPVDPIRCWQIQSAVFVTLIENNADLDRIIHQPKPLGRDSDNERYPETVQASAIQRERSEKMANQACPQQISLFSGSLLGSLDYLRLKICWRNDLQNFEIF